MDFTAFAQNNMTDSEKLFVEQTCRTIYGLIKKWNTRYPNITFKVVKSYLLNNPSKFDVQPEDKDELMADHKKIKELRSPQQELGGRDLDTTVLEAFSDLAKKFSHKWSGLEANGVTFTDLLQECYMKMFDALYYWNPDDNASLMTYLYKILSNYMGDVAGEQASQLSRINSEGIKIVKEFNQFKRQNPDLDQHELIDKINMDQQKKEHLKKAIVKILMESGIKSENGGQQSGDYTQFANKSVSCETDLLIDRLHVSEILDQSNLTEMERKVISQAIEDPYHGWQVNISKTLISEQTSEKVSRTRVGQLLEQAKAKVARTIQYIASR